MNALIEKFKQTQAYINYSRMWPYVKPYWFRALMAVLICIPIGSLDAVIALALKPYMDLVMVEKTVESPWYIPFGIVAFTCIQGMLNYLATYLNTWVGGKITNDLKFNLFKKMLTLPQTKKILHNPQKLIEVSTKMWLNNPRNHTYTATNGDFCQQVNHFAESHQGTAPSNKLYTNIIKEFMSFEFEGKKIDGSNSVKLIVPEAHIYQDAQEKMSSRQTITAPAPIRHGPWSGRGC